MYMGDVEPQCDADEFVTPTTSKCGSLNLHGDGKHQKGEVLGICGARGAALHAARTALLPAAAPPAAPACSDAAPAQRGPCGTPACGVLPTPCGWLVIVPNRSEFLRRGLIAQVRARSSALQLKRCSDATLRSTTLMRCT